MPIQNRHTKPIYYSKREGRLTAPGGTGPPQEKIGPMSADKLTKVDPCNMMSSGCLRLGIPSYMHLVETNTAVASRCLRPGKCSISS